MEDPKVLERMRSDWNERAGEDAYYYVAFGRRDQGDEEFFSTAADVVRLLLMELKRLPERKAALEIGCGPGRILKPLSGFFQEVHGVDVSDEMIRLAKDRLQGVPNAFPRHGSGSDLAMYPDGKFDFVYSYAVFQHIPSRDVVFNYLREAQRVLRPGGILRCQINGLPPHAKRYDTWSGVRITPDEIRALSTELDFQLLALEQIWTQYMWVTCCKRPHGWARSLEGRRVERTAVIRNISNAHTGERVAPASGPLGALSVWVEGLPAECDLNHLSVTADGYECRLTYVGVPEADGVSQVNVALPQGIRTGLAPVQVRWLGQELCDPGWVRIIPGAPPVATLSSVADGINLLSGTRIVTGTVKVTIEGLTDPAEFRVEVDGLSVPDVDGFCVDPMGLRHEFNFKLPAGTSNGRHEVSVAVGRRKLGPIAIEVAIEPFLAGATILALVAVVLMRPAPRRITHQFPAGVIEAKAELIVESGADVRGAPEGTILRMSPDFRGRAVIVARGEGIQIHDLIIEGNRNSRDDRSGLPPYDVPFAKFTRANGVLAQNVENFRVERVEFRNIGGFAVLVSKGRRVAIDSVRVSDSGSRNAAGRNNTTGGILLEEGVAEFRVTGCTLHDIRGNGIWTHSLYTSPRNGPGVIARNRMETVGRDAIQVGHAFGVRVEDNSGWRIGRPSEDVDIEGLAYPVGIDTAGNVDHSVYSGNRFEELNGKCIDLDGFHDGEVRGNTCVNRAPPESYSLGNFGIVMNNTNPDMRPERVRIMENTIDGPQFGGIFVIGTGNIVARNRLWNINRAHCNEDAARFGCYYAAGEPDMLRSGIYVGKGAERPAPARGNVIEGNEITGFEMKTRCIGRAPGIAPDWNIVRNNDCR